MEYTEVKNATGSAWFEFYHTLALKGFSSEQIEKLDLLLDRKDCFNDVLDCVMEAAQ